MCLVSTTDIHKANILICFSNMCIRLVKNVDKVSERLFRETLGKDFDMTNLSKTTEGLTTSVLRTIIKAEGRV